MRVSECGPGHIRFSVLDRDLDRLVTAAAPALCALKGVGTDVAGAVLVAAATTRSGFGQMVRLRISAAWHRCQHPPEKPAVVIGSTVAVTVTPTAHSGASSSCGSPPTCRPSTTWPGVPRRACQSRKSSDASSATSPAKSIASSSLAPVSPRRLDKQWKHHQRMHREHRVPSTRRQKLACGPRSVPK